MGKAVAVNLVKQSQESDRAPFLRSILNGLIYDGYRFPTEGSNGVIGPFTVSKAMSIFLRKKKENTINTWSTELHDKLGLLAAHITFNISVGQLKERYTDLQINLEKLHLTVRRRKCQLTIDDNGPSGQTARESIHMNRNTEWSSRPENLDELVKQLERQDRVTFSAEEVVSYLTEYEGLTQKYMKLAATGLKDAIKRTIHINAGGNVIVNFKEDSSWEGR